jgi:integrase
MLRVFLTSNDRAEFSTGVRCRVEEWNAPKGRLRGNDEAARVSNKRLKKLVAKAELKADRLQDAVDENPDLPPVRPAAVIAALSLKPTQQAPLLVDALRAAIPAAYALPATQQGAHLAVICLAKWPAAAKLRLPEFTSNQAASFVRWLQGTGLAPSSRRSYMGRLVRLLRFVSPTQASVFDGLRAGNSATIKPRRALSPEWLQKLWFADLNPVEAIARDVFFIQFYLHGSRIGAVLELQKSQIDWDNNRIRFTTQKVVLQKDVDIRPELSVLLRRYCATPGPMLLPVMPPNYFSLDKDARYQALNRARNAVKSGLIRAGQRINWTGSLHSHLARHSVALRAFQVSGDLRLAQEMLGHADTSMTARYIASLSTDELDKGANSVYDSLL